MTQQAPRSDDDRRRHDLAGTTTGQVEPVVPDEVSAPTPVDDPAGDAAYLEDTPDEPGPASQDGAPVELLEDPRSREELLAELSDAVARRDEYLDDLRRARAEFENYRRRMMREGSVQREGGKADLAAALLEVLDDLDRTLDAARASEDHGLAKGVELVASKLRTALEAHGLERIDEAGVEFDPERHEAVQHRDAEEDREQPVVAEILRPGYRWGDRVLRAAMVVVEG